MTGYDIQTLADRAEITDLFINLGRCLDDHDFDGLKGILTEDVVGTTPGGTKEGREALIEQARVNHEGYERLAHQFNSILVDVHGDTATVRAYVTGAFGHTDSSEPVRVLVGQYRNKLVRTAEGWRINELTVRPVFRMGEPAVAL